MTLFLSEYYKGKQFQFSANLKLPAYETGDTFF